ncbi:phenylalanine--tRNA ligase subunit beta [Euzebya tangerina]|uniref:phenylalanine--tRNA ligase subunit beta n=1 Tax=Euzebya tangerina TaxID=591198 RepID=UPI000E31F6D5|nr:phenylalanine--tRNA ligase subunit beta [Euzebya tangerina]
MRVPVSWLYEYVELALTPEELADVLTIGGLEVDSVDRPTAGAKGLTVVEVEAIEPVPKSDKLSLVHATDGQHSWEIVCGASNFSVGDRVPAALPGSTLPGGIEIGAKKLMGVTSNGMLASPRELGVGDDHSGIWLLGPDAPIGADVATWLDLDEAVIDIDLTPDRGYGASIWGLARDLAALTGAELTIPELAGNPGGDPGVGVTIEDATRCRRWDGRSIAGISVAPAPPLIQKRLNLVGMRPISNVVDATNYAMLETGYPVHAYDRALLTGDITVRRALRGEVLRTLDGTDRQLDPEDVVIADESGAIGLAGVMGGEVAEINPETTDLYVEVAAWNPVEVLRTGRRHRLHTEARQRFERTVSAQWLPVGASRVSELITLWAGGTVTGGHDLHPIPDHRPRIELRTSRVRSLLGIDIDADEQSALLTTIGCTVSGDGEVRTVKPPPYRPDLLIEEDLSEEIARLYGYDRIEPTVPSTGQSGRRSDADLAALAIRRGLAGAGWTEVLQYPFIADDDLSDLGLAEDDPRRQTIKLVNPLSKEESVLRTTLLPGLLATVRRNVNRQNSDVALFETGHVFVPPSAEHPSLDAGVDDVQLPAEPDHLGLIACGAFERRRHDAAARPVDFADVMGAVELVRRTIGAADLRVERTTEMPFHPGRAATVWFGDTRVGVVGELHPRVCAAYEVPARTVAAELQLDVITSDGIRTSEATVPSPLPGLHFDVAALVDESVPHDRVAAAVADAAGEGLASIELFDVFQGEQLGEGKKSLAFSLVLEDRGTQLTDTDEAAAIERIATAIEELGGQLRR